MGHRFPQICCDGLHLVFCRAYPRPKRSPMVSTMDDVWPTKSAIPNSPEIRDQMSGDDARAISSGYATSEGKVLATSKANRTQRRSARLQLTIDTDPLLTVEEVAARLRATVDWVWDHSSRRLPHLPVIRFGDGTLRYRHSEIEKFIDEHERLSNLRRKRR